MQTILCVDSMPIITTYSWAAASTAGLGSNSGVCVEATPIYFNYSNSPNDTNVFYQVLINVPSCPPYNPHAFDVIILPCAHAGIALYTVNNETSIYPNPNNGTFVIEPSNAKKQTMQVYDVNGKLVLSQTVNGKTSIDAGSLSEGIYNISLQSNEGVVNKRLVIVR